MDKEHLWVIFAVIVLAFIAYALSMYVQLIVTSIFLYYISRPIYRKVYEKTNMKRLSVVVAILSFSLPLSLFVVYMAYFGFIQLVNLVSMEQFNSIGPAFQETISSYFNTDNLTNISSTSSQIQNTGDIERIWGIVNTSLDSLLKSVSILFSVFLSMLILVTLTYYLLKDGDKLRYWIEENLFEDLNNIEEFLEYIDNELYSIFVGNILAAIIIAAMTMATYMLLNIFILPSQINVPYIALTGIVAGLASLIPIIGIKIVYVPITIYMYFILYINNSLEFFWAPAVFIGINMLIIDTIPEMIIRPYISSRNTHLGLLIMTYILGPTIFGWYGLFLGPIILVMFTAFIETSSEEVIKKYLD